jgi:hypothetical protein
MPYAPRIYFEAVQDKLAIRDQPLIFGAPVIAAVARRLPTLQSPPTPAPAPTATWFHRVFSSRMVIRLQVESSKGALA